MGAPSRRGGFTLVELLIVAAIIGVLAVLMIFSARDAVTRVHLAKVYTDMRNISNALEACRIDYNTFPKRRMGGIGFSSYAVYAKLTTPTPYLPTVLLDPFHPAEEEEFKAYMLTNVWDNKDEIHPWMFELGVVDRGVEIFFLSWGPDRMLSYLIIEGEISQERSAELPTIRILPLPYCLYDASNGLHSNGVIMRMLP